MTSREATWIVLKLQLSDAEDRKDVVINDELHFSADDRKTLREAFHNQIENLKANIAFLEKQLGRAA